jgi:Uma2 family endonuclease
MATIPSTAPVYRNDYPTSDGKPMAETDWHRDLMGILIQKLKAFFAPRRRVYVSGNLLLYYVRGNRRRHVSPDVFVVRGVPKHDRPNYLLWEEGRAPQVVIELTSSSTRREDQTTKRTLYQDTLKVREYFLFDPEGDYLDPPLQGYRLRQGRYRPIRAVGGRLPSQVLGLHLERDGPNLLLFDPATGDYLPTPEERAEAAQERAEAAQERAEAAQERAETAEEALQESETARQQAETEVERLRREIEELRRGRSAEG